MERPNFVEDKHLEYLDVLRDSGATNMFGATSYVQEAYPELEKKQAKDVLMYWMETFGDRHPNG